MEQLEGFMVFWIDVTDIGSHSAFFDYIGWADPMDNALTLMAELRKEPQNQFVTIVSQNSNSVGKPGVAAVENGKTPDGHAYDWSKAGRAGKSKRSRLAAEVKVVSEPTTSTTSNWIEP